MISFNNIPTTIRTPGVFTEVDNSRALQGLVANPHKVLILGQMEATGDATRNELKAITREGFADTFFGPGSILARMCNAFKIANPNTELFAIALSENAAGVAASGIVDITGSASGAGTTFLLINGVQVFTPITSGWSGADIASAMASDVNGNSTLACVASVSVTSTETLRIHAKASAEITNYFDFRVNYFEGQSAPVGVTLSVVGMSGGVGNPTPAGAWAVIENEQFQHIVSPYHDTTGMTSLEGELSDRWGPLVALEGHGYTALPGTAASATTFGNSRNSFHITSPGVNDSPTNAEEWAAVWAAVAAGNLNQDPARPLHTLQLPGLLAPPLTSRFTRTERDILLFDGIATWITDTSGNILIERSITMYQTNALGIIDPSYLDIQTIFTLIEIRFQYLVRMTNRFIVPRFKLADDTFIVSPGQKIVTPSVLKAEIIALFTQLSETGLVENIADFQKNLVVQRNSSDQNRVDVLLPPDLINQFRVLASQIQFIL